MSLLTKIRTQLRYYLVCFKAGIFISGLILGHSLVEHAVGNITMAYLLDDKNGTLRRSAIIVNAQDGLTSVLVIVSTYFAYNASGLFTTISFSVVPYIVGFVILWLLNPFSSGIYFLPAILIAIGGAGRDPLKAFLSNQLRRYINNPSLDNIIDDEKRVEATTYIWWQIPRFAGTLTATFVLGQLDWKPKFLISAIVLGCALLFFLSGYKYYRWDENPKSAPDPLVLIFRVIKAAINKRNLPYSDKPEDYYFKNDDNNQMIPLTPDVLFSRWLDKAAIIERTSSLSAEEQENQGTLCTVAQVKEVKFLMRMLPLWAIFMQYSILQATGNTFFYEQSDKLDYSISDNFKVPTISLYLTQSFSKYAISSVCDLIIFSKWFNVDKNKNYYLVATKVRIGIGLVCSCLCCFVARLVEIKRLQKINNVDYYLVIEGNTVYKVYRMSIFWLVPQFCLLGLSAGLIEDGVYEFFYYQTETLKDYVGALNEFVNGIGLFFSIFWVLTFRNWIGDSTDDSSLDKYFGILVIVSLVNIFIVYGFTFVYKLHYCYRNK